MILQPEDLPEGLSYEPRAASPPEEPWGSPEGWVAGYRLGAYLPHSDANEGDLVCVTGGVHLYETVAAAKAAWKRGHEQLEKIFQAAPYQESEWRDIPVPSLGDETAGYFVSARSNFCGWEDRQMETVTVDLRKGSLWVGLVTYTLGHGASLDAAIELAKKQLARVEAVLGE